MRLPIKKAVERVPFCIGHLMSKIPFSLRLGQTYTSVASEVSNSMCWTDEACEQYSIKQFREIVAYAVNEFHCYRNLYKSAGVLGRPIQTILDIQKLPVIDKDWVRKHVSEFSGAYRLNTGGSSGIPMSFYADRDVWAREWAHMHYIWSLRGYEYRQLKLTVRGRNLGSRAYVYNPVHNEFILNTYRSVSEIKKQILTLFAKRKVEFIHGYPSAIFGLMSDIDKYFSEDEKEVFYKNLKGLLLGSEFPFPNMVAKFREHHVPYISWYGHTEMCVLAYDETCMNRYVPFVTYGLAEVHDGHLLGTSFHNRDMPLIRYDTGDLVKQTKVTSGGLCREFAICEGRKGDFVVDCKGHHVPLTALIFGRHHHAFDVAEYIQVKQERPGEVTIFVTLNQLYNGELSALFDFTGVDMSFHYERLSKPIRTKLGKFLLRVPDDCEVGNETDPSII